MIKIQNLNKTYDKKRKHENHVLRDVSLTLPDKGFVCIVGVSGCGKTSLLNAIGGLDTFDSGTIETADVSVSRPGTRAYEQERNNSFGYIFQNYYLLQDHSVAYNVYLGLHSLGLSHGDKLKRVKEALQAVNMSRYAKRIVGELSGGQQQRVAIARAIARHPAVIFADEPTGNLDEENTANICKILRKLSKTSLVVMVTHEENIARFFADRIIRLGEGRVENDDAGWQREGMSVDGGRTLYTGDYTEERLDGEQVSLRILTEADAAPVTLTAIVCKDKIVIKLDDERTVNCSKTAETPALLEGKRPVLTLEEVDNASAKEEEAYVQGQNPQAGAGRGLTFAMMVQEAGRLLFAKNGRKIGAWCFLALLSVLTVWITGDYLTVASVDPKDFVITDSHVLELAVDRGPDLDPYTIVQNKIPEVAEYLRSSALDMDIIPFMNTQASISITTFPQLENVSVKLFGFSSIPVERLNEEELICGRMPENSEEVVVDRWVLDTFLEEDGVLQNIIGDIDNLLGKQLSFYKKDFAPTIVGICDCSEPHIYFTKAGLIAVGLMGKEMISLSELQRLHPGEYDELTLQNGECLVITNNAGVVYKNKVGSQYNLNIGLPLKITGAFEEDTFADIVVADVFLDDMLQAMAQSTLGFCFYAEDKQALKQFIEQDLKTNYEGQLKFIVKDYYGDSWEEYRKASTLKADARIIITVTLIALSMLMLYLLQRAFVWQRIGMMSVYRLLGIPGRKLIAIFAMESLAASCISVLPAAVLTYGAVAVLNRLPSLEFAMVMPWQAALSVSGGITVYYLFVSLFPVYRLLQLPPARLAAKYDI